MPPALPFFEIYFCLKIFLLFQLMFGTLRAHVIFILKYTTNNIVVCTY